jgi:hypothetical protein
VPSPTLLTTMPDPETWSNPIRPHAIRPSRASHRTHPSSHAGADRYPE